MPTSARTARPSWFEDAIRTPFEDRFIDVADPEDLRTCRIHYQLYTPTPAAGPPRLVLLVHGGGAHSRWWDWTSPFLARDGFLVAAIDLSGQGDSGRRELYSMDHNAREVMALADALVASGAARPRPFLVGHSFGGWVVLSCGRQWGERLGGAVTLDTPVFPPDAAGGGPPPRTIKKRGESGKEEMLARFRLMPPQEVVNTFLMDYIAPLSLTYQEGGDDGEAGCWVWKDDAERMAKTRFIGESSEDMIESMSKLLRGVKCRLACVYGSRSVMFSDPKTLPYMRRELDEHRPGGEGHTPLIAIEDAAHHLMFDQPLVLVACLRSLFAEWERTQARL